MKVTVCFATIDQQWLIAVEVPPHTTVIKAIIISGILDLYPIVLNNNVGIYSKKVALDTVLQEGDRVEIYRPLQFTPNQQRLLRAKKIKPT